MGLIDRVLARPTGPTNSGLNDPQVPLTGQNVVEYLNAQFGGRTESTVMVTESSALAMSAVWRSATLIAGTAAALPLHPYRRQDTGAPVRVTSGQAADLLDTPHPDLTPFELWEIVYTHLLLWGNAYVQKLRNGNGRVAELWPIHPSRVTARRDTVSMAKRYRIEGDPRERGDDQILHIPGFGYDGVRGLSAIGCARQGIGVGLAAEQFAGRLFGNGSLAGGILTTDQRLQPDKAEVLKARWNAKMAGLDNSHNVAVLDSGAKFQQLTIPPEDAQFLQSRSFQIDEIARFFGIPPHMLMQMDKSTSWGTGIEQQTLGFIKYTLAPWLTRVEQRVTTVLKPEPVYAKYSLEGLLRGDSASRGTYYKQMFDLGALSTNEIRELEERPPVEGGDTHYRPLNMGELGTSDTPADTATATEGQPAPAADPIEEGASTNAG